MAKFLITGGAGFIGSSIAEELSQKGHFVRVLDNFTCGSQENIEFSKKLGVDKFELIRGDITNPSDCDKAAHGMDYILHQASLKTVSKSMLDPLNYNNVNINGVLFMLQAASKHKIKRFVFASSSSIYGTTQNFPEKEEHLPLLISPYALTKLAGEYYCRIFSESFGVETVCLRYFNIFGPKQSLDDEYSAVVPKFIHSFLNNQNPQIYGNGKQSRDFTYIDNVVSANILSAITPGIKHEVFNVATGQDHTVLELASHLNRILGKSLEPEFLPVRSGDLFRSSADTSKTTRILNYKPLVSFEDGLKKTVDYFKKIWI